MHVKRIEINGFKSFAHNTAISFDTQKKGKHSITAIVGPNGAGKSNVADAFRWVMGEQRIKHLRGKKNEDIIFAGSDGKGKMSLASVTLVLDNSDHRAPIEFEELIIARKLYRSGDSEYLLNGKQVRLMDLHMLLAQAQFGQGSYSVIGQGMIDRLLLQTSAERKNFFDEAVGIKEFQIKRHHAVLKLKRTDENIAQADVLLQEIEPRLRSLRRQVKKLEQRQDVEIQLRDLQEQYYVTQHINLTEQIDALQSGYDVINKDYSEVEKKLRIIQEELAVLAQEKSRQELFQTLQDEYQILQQKKNELERNKAIVAGKLQTEFSKVGKQNVGWLEQKIGELDLSEKKLINGIKEEEIHRDKIEIKLKELSQKLDDQRHQKIVCSNKQLEFERQLADLKQGRDDIQFHGLRAVNAILQQTKGALGGHVYGVIAQLARVDEKYRLALEVAAQAHLSSLVVENEDVAQKGIDFLKKQQLGFATFLPLTTIRERMVSQDIHELAQRRGVYGLATQLVDFDNTFSHIFSYVFGSTLIVEDIDVARDIGIGRVRMVTLEGDILETSGSMKGGFRRRRRGALSFAGGTMQFSEHAITQIEESLIENKEARDRIEIDIENIRESLSHAQTDTQVLVQKIELLQKQHTSMSQEKSQLEQELSMYSLSGDQYNDMMAQFATQKDDITGQIDVVQEDLDKVSKKIKNLNEEEEHKRKRIFLLQDTMQTEQSSLNKLGDKRHTVHVDITRLQTHQEDLEQEIFNELKEGVGVLKEKKVDKIAEEDFEQTKIDIEKFKYKLSLIGGIDEEVLTEYSETKERYDSLSAELEDLQKAMTDLEKLITELDKIMKKKHTESFKKIKKEFARYFKLLFEGGEAELVEVYESDGEHGTGDERTEDFESDDVEEKKPKRAKKILQGVEVYARPPGKKINSVTALSGGERTMTSIALLCAILHTNPSPFVLLDEVEAALDESNTERFTKILTELSVQSQFIIITHNRVTMHAADVLYGVTMGNDGISKLVSVKLDNSG